MNCMVDSKENYKFDLGVKGLMYLTGEMLLLKGHKPRMTRQKHFN